MVGALVGGVTGLLGASLVWGVIQGLDLVAEHFIHSVVIVFLIYIGIVIGARRGEWFEPARIIAAFKDASRLHQYKVLDTSVIIDGRIADICETGFLEGTLVVPQFVLRELQQVADSSDSLKRNRGRRGLDVLQRVQKMTGVQVQIVETDFPEVKEVDLKLIELAKRLSGKIVTNDFNLNKVAQLRGVAVLNINELANSLKPVVLPGEVLRVLVVKEGKEAGQGVAYLDDGTMVVVEQGRRAIGRMIEVTVTSVLQLPAGKMIFCKWPEGLASGEAEPRREARPQDRRDPQATAATTAARRAASRTGRASARSAAEPSRPAEGAGADRQRARPARRLSLRTVGGPLLFCVVQMPLAVLATAVLTVGRQPGRPRPSRRRAGPVARVEPAAAAPVPGGGADRGSGAASRRARRLRREPLELARHSRRAGAPAGRTSASSTRSRSRTCRCSAGRSPWAATSRSTARTRSAPAAACSGPPSGSGAERACSCSPRAPAAPTGPSRHFKRGSFSLALDAGVPGRAGLARGREGARAARPHEPAARHGSRCACTRRSPCRGGRRTTPRRSPRRRAASSRLDARGRRGVSAPS